MPWINFDSPAVMEPAGSVVSMSSVVPSWTPLFSPLYFWADVSATVVQQNLRRIFTRWGLPCWMRADNGKPWGTSNDLPPALALWTIGLGVGMIWTDPCCPQQNGTTERSQGTTKRWSEPGTCQTAAELQQRVNEDDVRQRERYPVTQKKSRWQLYPQLAENGRKYQQSSEAEQWQLQRVQAHLSGYCVARKVDKDGRISLYNRNRFVGKPHVGKQVYVSYDPDQGHWLVQDDEGRQVRTLPAPEISTESICALQVARK